MKRIVTILGLAAATLVLGILVLAPLTTGAASPTPTPTTTPATAGYHGLWDATTLTRVAELLKVTPEELTAQLEEGKSLLEIAQAQGVTAETLVATILAPYREHLALAVKYGYLTQAEADDLLAQAQTRVTENIAQTTTGTAPWSGDEDMYEDMAEHCPMMNGATGGGMMSGGMMGGSMGGDMMGNGMMGGGMGGSGMMNGGMMGGNSTGSGTTPQNRQGNGMMGSGMMGGSGKNGGGMMGGGMMGGGMMGNFGWW